MAERRMFAKSIIDSDLFLDMPLSTQALYFHMGMRADDDGFVNNPKRIQRTANCSDDDLKLLIAKGFIMNFESGVVVIRHWRIHNYIQKDRYRKTQYIEELAALTFDANNSYILMGATCIYSVNIMDTQVRIVEDSIDLDKFSKFWSVYPKKQGKGAAEKAWRVLNPSDELFSQIISAVNLAKQCDQWNRDNGLYIPNPATWLNQKRWDDEYQISIKNTDRGENDDISQSNIQSTKHRFGARAGIIL